MLSSTMPIVSTLYLFTSTPLNQLCAVQAAVPSCSRQPAVNRSQKPDLHHGRRCGARCLCLLHLAPSDTVPGQRDSLQCQQTSAPIYCSTCIRYIYVFSVFSLPATGGYACPPPLTFLSLSLCTSCSAPGYWDPEQFNCTWSKGVPLKRPPRNWARVGAVFVESDNITRDLGVRVFSLLLLTQTHPLILHVVCA